MLKIFIVLFLISILSNQNLKPSLREKSKKKMLYKRRRLGHAMRCLRNMSEEDKAFIDNFLDEKLKTQQAQNKISKLKHRKKKNLLKANHKTTVNQIYFHKKDLSKSFYAEIIDILKEYKSKIHTKKIEYKNLFTFLEKKLGNTVFKLIFEAAPSEKWTLNTDLPYITIPKKPFLIAFNKKTKEEQQDLFKSIRKFFEKELFLYPIKKNDFSKHKENLKTLLGINKVSKFLILTTKDQ